MITLYHLETKQAVFVTRDPREAVELANTMVLFKQLRARGVKGTARELRKAHGPHRVDWSVLAMALEQHAVAKRQQ
jgi:hypothetical protein